MTGLSVRGLTVRRGRRVVLEDVSFSAAAGAITAILGPAGAGKTSLLAAMAGLLDAERGAVFCGGKDVTGLSGRRRGIGFLAPGAVLPDASTTEKALRPFGRGAPKDAVATMLTALAPGLAELAPKNLSHGEAVLALGVARLLPGGDALLVDEAGIGLDEGAVRRFLAHLRQVAGSGRSVLLATRSPAVALRADHLVLLAEGRVLQAGTPASLYAEPRSAAAAFLTGEANILQGRIRELRPGGFVWTGGGRFVQSADPDMPRPSLGEEVTICIRPERFTLLAGAEIAENMVEAEITDVRSAGPLLHVNVITPLGDLLVAVPSWRQAFYPAPGQQGRIGWAAGAGWVL